MTIHAILTFSAPSKLLASSPESTLFPEKIYGPYDEVDYLSGKHRFAFTYKKDGQEYLNVNDKIYGHYDYIHFGNKLEMKNFWGFLHMKENEKEFSVIVNDKEFGPFVPPENLAPDVSFQIAEEHWGVITLKNQKNYVLIDGKNEYGPFQEVTSYTVDREGWRFLSIKDETFFVHVNGKEFGPYPAPGVKEYLFLPTFEAIGRNWYVSYFEQGSWHFIINGQTLGPFPNDSYKPGSLILGRDGYGFIFKKNNEWYYHINGKEKKADEKGDPEYKILEEDYSKNFSKDMAQEPCTPSPIQPYLTEKNGMSYVHLNGVSYGPFATVFEEAFFTPTHWAFTYKKELNSDNYYAMINGKEYGPFREEDFRFMRLQICSSHWGFEMEKEGQLFLTFDGKELGPFQSVNYSGELMLRITETNFGFSYRKKENSYVQINGREYGPGIKNFAIQEPYWLIRFEQKGKHYVRIGKGTNGHPTPLPTK